MHPIQNGLCIEIAGSANEETSYCALLVHGIQRETPQTPSDYMYRLYRLPKASLWK